VTALLRERAAAVLRTACYARFSSDLQRSTSIDDQVRACREHAEKSGWTWQADHVYTDKAISGSSIEGRAGLQALQAAALSNPRPFDVLLVDDSSRVARDLPDALRVLQALKFAGVRVIYISQNIDSTSESAETLICVHGLVDSLYLKEMAAKIKRGLRGQAERGYATGSVTYGYRTIPEPDPNRAGEFLGWRTEIDEAEAAVVRQVFDWYVGGVTLPQILKGLRTGPYPAPRGPRACGKWNRGAVVRLLQNERYLGCAIWGQRRFERKPGTRKKVARPAPRSEWVIIPRPDLRIIGEDTWQKAQTRRQDHAATTKPHRHKGNLISGRVAVVHGRALFSGLMTCGVCGGSMSVVHSRTVKGVQYSYYGCYRAHRDGDSACSNRVTARAEQADPVLLSGLEAELKRPDTIDRIVAEVTARLRTASDRKRSERKALLKTRDEIQQKVQRLLAAIEGGISSPALLGQLQAREAELAAIEAEINAPQDAPTIGCSPAAVKRHLEDWGELLRADIATVKAHLSRHGVAYTLTPVYEVAEGDRPYLRADGEAQFLKGLFGAHDRLSPRSAR
jgi:site-specific DNA recombinase